MIKYLTKAMTVDLWSYLPIICYAICWFLEG